MSDRRSFSEIPAEMLRDHGADDRIERGWQRLAGEVAAGPRRRRTQLPVVAVAAVTFGLGVFVGADLWPREPAPLPAFGAEPAAGIPLPTAQQATPPPTSSSTNADVPRSRQTRHAPPHRADVAPRAEVEPAPAPAPAEAPASAAVSWQRLADE